MTRRSGACRVRIGADRPCGISHAALIWELGGTLCHTANNVPAPRHPIVSAAHHMSAVSLSSPPAPAAPPRPLTPATHRVRTRSSPRSDSETADFQFFLQSISNFYVSLPNVSKGCEGATVPAVAPSHIPDHWSKSGRAVARFSPSKSGRAVARFSPSKSGRAVAHISPCNEGKPSYAPGGKKKTLSLPCVSHPFS